jgi:hypothetical protein
MKTGGHKEVRTDYIFARYPLWVRYSGLPVKIGPGPWCIFQRLLELMERFGNNKFHYSIERLGLTAGVSSQYGVKKILDRLASDGLLRYETHHGRGKETEFEILLPLKTPIPEEDVYHVHPRLRSRTYQKQLENKPVEKNPNNVVVLKEENLNNVGLLRKINPNNVVVLKEENLNEVALLRNNVEVFEKNDGPDVSTVEPEMNSRKTPHEKDKKDLYKKDNNNKNDLSHEDNQAGPKEQVRAESHQGEVVVALSINKLKEYGISGEDAEKWLKKYSPDFLHEKIEIIEYKKHSGEQIRNIGGMLKKAIEGDWQPPEGFTTIAERAAASRQEKEEKEAAARAARENKEKETRERDLAIAAEEWKKTAPREQLERIRERARREVLEENPNIEEKLLRMPIRLRENKIIAEEGFLGARDRGS